MLSTLHTIAAGMAGMAAMTLVMTVIHRAGWANADMIRALGSCFTRRYENALLPGLVIHVVSGVAFAFPYALVLSGVGLTNSLATAGLGALIGFVHGFAMSFILVAVVAEKHPLEQFRNAGFEVAAAHIVGHITYGVGVGAVVGMLGVSYGFRLGV
jgi:uncharacterized membrane protein YagU involved in acid resistance